jgi:hypothetical protein
MRPSKNSLIHIKGAHLPHLAMLRLATPRLFWINVAHNRQGYLRCGVTS